MYAAAARRGAVERSAHETTPRARSSGRVCSTHCTYSRRRARQSGALRCIGEPSEVVVGRVCVDLDDPRVEKVMRARCIQQL